MLTEQQLQEMRERIEIATGGEWHTNAHFEIVSINGNNYDILGDMYSEEDAHFVVYARQDVPTLIAEVERLKEALEQIQSDLIPLRGKSNNHDAEITGVCIRIRKVIDGGEYDE